MLMPGSNPGRSALSVASVARLARPGEVPTRLEPGCKAAEITHIGGCTAWPRRSIWRGAGFSSQATNDRDRFGARPSQPAIAGVLAPAPRRPAVDLGGGFGAARQG